MKGNKTAILFAANGITEDARNEIVRLAANNISIICITADELQKLNNSENCKKLILDKWQVLQEMIDIADVI